jgi:hypothetical protein
MADFRPGDHAMGLELQLEELIEQRQRASVQGQLEDARRLGDEIAALQNELAATAERAALEATPPEPAPELHNAEELNAGDDAP